MLPAVNGLKSPETVRIEYEFALGKDVRKQFAVSLQKPGLGLVVQERGALPAWTHLNYHQCPNCPLDPARHRHCPVAANLVDVIESFHDCVSTEEAEIVIRHAAREYHRRASVQYGVSSLMGLYMVTSGCPILDKLRPMVQTHLPFATIDETTYRVVSMYLLAQYFLHQRGRRGDWKLHQLVRICEDINQVNQAFVGRIQSIRPQDASLNAIVNLDCFPTLTAFSITRNSLKGLEALFGAYLDTPDQEAKPREFGGSAGPRESA
jgi:hypothetical protein